MPILLKEIHKCTDSEEQRSKIEKVIDNMNESLRKYARSQTHFGAGSIDDSVQWLHNFERLQQLQTQVIWPSIAELEPRAYVPDVS